MSADDLRRFTQRDWAAIARAKERHWLRQRSRMTITERWERADELLRHARTVQRDKPGISDRSADVDVHRRVGQALRAVTHAGR